MAYRTGTFSNSHELIGLLGEFLTNNGWRTVSVLKAESDSGDGYDIVFHSTGEKEDKNIYVRFAAGLADKSALGDTQQPYSDGYTEYVNGFAYSYFPDNGMDGEGLSELGWYGPLLYTWVTDTATVMQYNLWNWSGTQYAKSAATSSSPNPNQVSLHCRGAVFDGKGKAYQSGSGAYYRANLMDGTVSDMSATSMPTSNYISKASYIKASDGTEYVFLANATRAAGLAKYNIGTNTWTSSGVSGAGPFSIAATPYFGATIAGVRRNRGSEIGARIYVICGSGTTEWAMFDVDRNVWTPLLSPSLPAIYNVAGATGDAPGCAIYVTKEQSGYEYDRIYMFTGNNTTGFYSVPIGDDGYTAGPFFTHASLPEIPGVGSGIFVAGNTIFYATQAPGLLRALYKFVLPAGDPDQVGSWQHVEKNWFTYDNDNAGNGPLMQVHEHLANRAHVTEFDANNKYWFFADMDRIVVVIKNAAGRYNYIYSGLFSTYLNTRTTTTITQSDADNTILRVADSSIFELHKAYIICDQSGAEITYTGLTGETKSFAPCEMTYVRRIIDGTTILVDRLLYSYSVGSIIGEDPIPLMTRTHTIEQAQTINNVNLRNNGFTDIAWQRYRIMPAVDTDFSTAAYSGSRNNQKFFVPLVLVQGGTFEEVGKEVRGQLKNVYATGSVASETEVTVGSKTYIAFDIYESDITGSIIIGPTE